MKGIIVLVMFVALMMCGCVSAEIENNSSVEEVSSLVKEDSSSTASKEPTWRDELSPKIVSDIEKAFTEIGENPDNIIKVEYVKTRTSGYIFERKDYKVEFSWSLGKPGYKHSRYYLITTQNYFEGEPEKEQYPEEFLTTVRYWVGDDGYGTNVNQWSWTGNGEKQ